MIRCFWVAIVVALIGISPASAKVTLTGEAMQGGLLHGRAAPGSTVMLDGKRIAVAPDGVFVLGFGRDARPRAVLTVRSKGGHVEKRALKVRQRHYRISRIEGLPPRKVEPTPADVKRILAEQKLLVAARRKMSGERGFRETFIWPTHGRISGVYGSQRILNGKPRHPHLGVDIAAPSGTPVVAAADGVVSLVHENMFFTGNTVMIDHGLGVSSVYIHLSAIDVKQGQHVHRGQRIGLVGQTGRATGPHLHWGVTWRDVRLDPALLAGPMPKPGASN